MRYLILVAILGMLVGCQSSVVDEAAAACEDAGWSRSQVLEAILMVDESARDTGATSDQMRDSIDWWCSPFTSEGRPDDLYDECLDCLDAIIDAVYGQ